MEKVYLMIIITVDDLGMENKSIFTSKDEKGLKNRITLSIHTENEKLENIMSIDLISKEITEYYVVLNNQLNIELHDKAMVGQYE